MVAKGLRVRRRRRGLAQEQLRVLGLRTPSGSERGSGRSSQPWDSATHGTRKTSFRDCQLGGGAEVVTSAKP